MRMIVNSWQAYGSDGGDGGDEVKDINILIYLI